MSATTLLDCLDGLRSTGSSKWLARCPAHDDRSPSLAIRELDDGRLLVHCFAGCDVGAVLDAVGLEFSDLYPERPLGDPTKRESRPFPAGQILQAVSHEALIAAVAASNMAQGEALTHDDRARLVTAAARLQTAVEVAYA